MAKLYFRYGTVGSAKTLNLLAVAHNYTQQNKRPYIIVPELDVRFGRGVVRSRAGIKKQADLLVGPESIIDRSALEGVDCVLVDEAQFLSLDLIDQLRAITTEQRIPVICYGLRTDFRAELFSGSRRLLEIADAIEEVKTTCYFCNRKAIYNLKLVDGLARTDGPSVELGAEERYLPACPPCYADKLAAGERGESAVPAHVEPPPAAPGSRHALRQALLGTWRLVSWTAQVGEPPGPTRHPFGEDCEGRLTYTDEGRVWATLMRRDRPTTDSTTLSGASVDERAEMAAGYVAYSGTFELGDGEVVHHVDVALFANRVGRALRRSIEWLDDDLVLTARGVSQRSGAPTVNRLRWQREDL